MRITKNKKTAEIVGLSYGDGSLTRRKNGKLRYQIRGHIEEKEFYDNYVKPLFDKSVGEIFITSYSGKKPYYGVATENQKICNYIKSLEVPFGIKGELKIPSWISSNKEYLKCFLRGFFDTDGSVFCQKNYTVKSNLHRLIKINFASTSRQLIRDIHISLKKIGIKSYFKNPVSHKEYDWRALHILRIDINQDVEKWFNTIGSNNPKNITKYQVWKKFGFCPPYTSIKHRRRILNNQINPMLFYENLENNAEVAEPGQMRKSQSRERLVEGLVP